MNNRKAMYLIVPFLIIVFGIGIINFIKKDKEISEAENRNLQKRPTIENLKEKNFTTTYEAYYTDQFIGRDKLLKLDTKLQMLSNKSNIKGHYITKDKWILGGTATTKKTEKDYKGASDLINDVAKKVKKQGKDVYYVSLPHKVNTLDYMYPKYIDKSYGIENNDLLLSMLNKNNIKTIDVGKYFVDNFSHKELERFYFKTDHHWNSIGAYESFKYLIEKLNKGNYINVNLDNYNYKTTYLENKNFIGSYNRNLYKLYSAKEAIPYVYMDREYDNKYYELKDGKFEEAKRNDIIANGIKGKDVNYEDSYTRNLPYYKIVNEEAITDKKVLLVRDSYQAPLTWLFSDVFKQVEVVDPRQVNMNIDEILNKSDSDMVIMMFNNGLNVEDMMNNIK